MGGWYAERAVVALSCDTVVYAVDSDYEAWVVLIRRGIEPELGKWALPGGFVEPGERLVEAAARELREETGLKVPLESFELITILDEPGRDPRGRTVTAVYRVRVSPVAVVWPGDDAAEAIWIKATDVLGWVLAFDHNQALIAALTDDL